MAEALPDPLVDDRPDAGRPRAEPSSRGLVAARAAVALYAAGGLLHLAHAVLLTDPRTVATDWDTFLALEVAVYAPLWPLALLARLLGLMP